MLLKPLMSSALLPTILLFILLTADSYPNTTGKLKPSGSSASRRVSPCLEFASSHRSSASSIIFKCFFQPVELCGSFCDASQGLVEPLEPGVWCWGISLRKTLGESQTRVLRSCRGCSLSSLQIPAPPSIPVMSPLFQP